MTGNVSDQPPASPEDTSARPTPRPAGSAHAYPVSETTGAGHASLHRPRVRMLATSDDLTPAGASFTPPTPTPLPERGAGFFLLLSVVAAVLALVFVVLLATKL